MRESLVDFEMMSWLDARGIGAFAWTVNDIDRVNELIRLGVTGITTDNLAILSLLGGQAKNVPGGFTSPAAGDPTASRLRAEREGG